MKIQNCQLIKFKISFFVYHSLVDCVRINLFHRSSDLDNVKKLYYKFRNLKLRGNAEVCRTILENLTFAINEHNEYPEYLALLLII